jgi:hypothetical protein
MALHLFPSDAQPERDARGFIPDADACVDELLALAEWLRDRRTGREVGDSHEDAAA